MPKGPLELRARMLTPEETDSLNGRSKKQLMVDWLKQQFIDPETGQPIQVGQGIEIGPFDTEAEGRNWVRHFLSEVYPQMGWGKEKTKAGKVKPPVIAEPKPRDGKFYMWLVRVRE